MLCRRGGRPRQVLLTIVFNFSVKIMFECLKINTLVILVVLVVNKNMLTYSGARWYGEKAHNSNLRVFNSFV